MRATTDVAVTYHENGAVLLHLRTSQFLFLNPVASIFWQRVSQGDSLEAAVEYIARQYSITAERVRADLELTVKQLKAHGMLIKPPLPSPPRPNWHYRAAGTLGLLGALIMIQLPMGVMIKLARLARYRRREPVKLEPTRRIAKAAQQAGRFYPGRVACLELSLAALIGGAILNAAPEWRLGAAFGQVYFHAWTEVNGELVEDPEPDKPAFQALIQI
jgi:hypothetical protein